MGIDIFARFSVETPEDILEHSRRIGLYQHGYAATVREAYHGRPYATTFLFQEAFDRGEAWIPASTLRRRLPEALRLARHRARVVYDLTAPADVLPVLNAFTAFVECCERMERASGRPTLIVASY